MVASITTPISFLALGLDDVALDTSSNSGWMRNFKNISLKSTCLKFVYVGVIANREFVEFLPVTNNFTC